MDRSTCTAQLEQQVRTLHNAALLAIITVGAGTRARSFQRGGRWPEMRPTIGLLDCTQASNRIKRSPANCLTALLHPCAPKHENMQGRLVLVQDLTDRLRTHEVVPGHRLQVHGKDPDFSASPFRKLMDSTIR